MQCASIVTPSYFEDHSHDKVVICFSSCNLPFCGLIGNIFVTFVENCLLITPIYLVIEAQIHSNSNTLRRCQMTVMPSRITDQSSVLFNSYLRQTTQKHQRSVLPSICEENPPVTGGFLPQGDSNAKYVCI